MHIASQIVDTWQGLIRQLINGPFTHPFLPFTVCRR